MAVEDVLAAAKCFVCRLLPYFSAYSAVKLEATETMQPKLSKAATLHSFPPSFNSLQDATTPLLNSWWKDSRLRTLGGGNIWLILWLK